jgi:hypothetical protein
MGKVWVLDTETKGTGANMVPLEKVLRQPARETEPASPGRKPGTAPGRAQDPPRQSRKADGSRSRSPKPAEKRSSPLPAGHVRKKATGEIGRVQSVDPSAGTASVLWLRQGTTSTVPLTAISRR